MNELLVLKVSLPEVAAFQSELEGRLRAEGFSDDLIHDLSLVSEEVLVNIIHYGYEDGKGGAERLIKVRLQIDEGRTVHLEVRDDGQAFDPLQVEERNPEDDRLGGWGISMLKTLTDRVEYRRECGENVLLLQRAERDS